MYINDEYSISTKIILCTYTYNKHEISLKCLSLNKLLKKKIVESTFNKIILYMYRICSRINYIRKK